MLRLDKFSLRCTVGSLSVYCDQHCYTGSKTLRMSLIEFFYKVSFEIEFSEFLKTKFNIFLFINSERSDECIDFTMMCVFFFLCVSVYSITSRRNAPISNFGGGFR
ncbi:Uncharacterized protein FWK35_00018728 [Aphis craccivora]|uniref:Uncharacterized protein n=1 Tax=Aphis craccivora TaxID=307492 RepID=A0A6G0YJ66_APHCR|nr:Uncharacterized protein FWK35_00018728 [Aphis craccivora]